MSQHSGRTLAPAREFNFDGLVGPTHNFAGLSSGNLASASHKDQTSYPRTAALEGLAKMRVMVGLGVPQGVLPPQQRPSPAVLARLGYPGALEDAVRALAADDQRLLVNLSSASAMWAANAATVSPSADTADHRVHFTPANLSSTLHRSLEAATTTGVLRSIFANPDHFVVHDPLPSHPDFADEGAANHGRFSKRHGDQGHELFVYGRDDGDAAEVAGFPRRQTRQASAAIARSHGLAPGSFSLIRQDPRAIDAGAFHNDVVSVSNGMVLFTHELAISPADADALASVGVSVLVVPADEVSLADAVSSYLFNSQLVTLPEGSMVLIAPMETASNPAVSRFLDRLVAKENEIAAVHRVDVRQSMSNGGGPACLRLRVVLTEDEVAALSGSVILDLAKIDRLEAWVGDHYRDQLQPEDLADPSLALESQAALGELEQILELEDLYGDEVRTD